MPKLLRVLPRSALLAGLVLPWGAAFAQAPAAPPLTAMQSASLDRAVRLWTNTPAPENAGAVADFTITPEGDHYRLDKPLPMGAVQPGVVIHGGGLTAAVRPLDGGRWQFSDIQFGMPVTIGAPAGKDSKRVAATLDLNGQTGTAAIDPSLSTVSTFDGAASGMTGSVDITVPAPADAAISARTSVSLRSGAIRTHGVWQPAAPGRIDRSAGVDLDDLAIDFAGKQKVSVAIQAFQGDLMAKGLSPDRLAAVTALLRDRLPEAMKARAPESAGVPAGRRPLTPEQRQALHAMLDDMRDLASSFDLGATLDNVAFSSGDHVAQLRKIALAEGVGSSGGRADAHLRLVVEGLTSPDIPPGLARAYLPHRLVIAPRISGIATDALFDAIGAAIDEGKANPQEAQARAAALLAHGPVSVGLDELAFDMGPTQVNATGAVQVASTNLKDLTGSATIEAKHFSALIKSANADPLLRKAAPVLIFLKGIGDEDDNGNVVWKVTYGGGKVLVNGTDLSQMLPHK